MIVVAIPDLDRFGDAPEGLPPLLRKLMARAERRELQSDGWASELVTGRPLPVAPLTRLLDAPDDSDGCWLRADPIRLQPDLNAVWVSPGARLQQDHPLVAEFSSGLSESGLAFDLPHPERGYVRLESLPDCEFVPPDKIVGQSLDFVLPSGPDGALWQRLLNDCQMIAHQHALTGDAGRPGGLWFWGGGTLPPSDQIAARVQHLYGVDPLWSALARWLNLSHDESTPTSLNGLPDSSLVEWHPASGPDARSAMEALDDWLRPLWRRLRTGGLDGLAIASRSHVWRLNAVAAWQVWRRSPETWR